MSTEVWKTFTRFLYTGELSLTQETCADALELMRQLGLGELLPYMCTYLDALKQRERNQREFEAPELDDVDKDTTWAPPPNVKTPESQKRKADDVTDVEEAPVIPVKRGRGRPRKKPVGRPRKDSVPIQMQTPSATYSSARHSIEAAKRYMQKSRSGRKVVKPARLSEYHSEFDVEQTPLTARKTARRTSDRDSDFDAELSGPLEENLVSMSEAATSTNAVVEKPTRKKRRKSSTKIPENMKHLMEKVDVSPEEWAKMHKKKEKGRKKSTEAEKEAEDWSTDTCEDEEGVKDEETKGALVRELDELMLMKQNADATEVRDDDIERKVHEVVLHGDTHDGAPAVTSEAQEDGEVKAQVLDVDAQRRNGRRLLVTNAPLLSENESQAAIYDGKDELPLTAPRVLVDQKKRVIGYLPPQTIKRVHVVRCRYCNEQLNSITDLPRHMIKKHSRVEKCGTQLLSNGDVKEVKLLGEKRERLDEVTGDYISVDSTVATSDASDPALKDVPSASEFATPVTSTSAEETRQKLEQKRILTKVVKSAQKTHTSQVVVSESGMARGQRISVPAVQLHRNRPKVIVESPVVNEDGKVIRSKEDVKLASPPNIAQEISVQPQTNPSESKTFIQFQDDQGRDHMIEINTAALLQTNSGTLFMDNGQLFVDGSDVTFEAAQVEQPSAGDLFEST